MNDALAEIQRLNAEEPEVDAILRGAVRALVERGGCSGAAIWFVEGDGLELGPTAGEPIDLSDPAAPAAAGASAAPVAFDGRRVAIIAVTPPQDDALLARVAAELAGPCLVGWDTGGVSWEELA